MSRGRGRILWSPLPVEVSDEADSTAALYRMAMREAGVRPLFTTDAPSSVLVYPARYARHTLYTHRVRDEPRDARARHRRRRPGQRTRLMVPGGRAALILMDRQTGREVTRYPSR